MQELAFGVLELLHDLPFKLPQDVIYVMRVSSLIEGLGTQLDPTFNGIKDVLPILKENLPRALGEDEGIFDKVIHELVQLPLTLSRARQIIELAHQGDLALRLSPADRDYLMAAVNKHMRRLGWLIFWLALAFYLLLLQAPWSTPLSGVCLLLSGFVLLRKKIK
jgi:predicted unusual protein kinase regulating ubiquinone biosynthesis (AarF/ABC1/UbiB family)